MADIPFNNPILLPADPTLAMHAATKQYLDNANVTIGSTVIAIRATVTALAGLTSVTSTNFIGALTGNADTATKLATARTISLTGDATGSGIFDGSGDLSIAVTVAGGGSGGLTYTESDTAPASPSVGNEWLNTLTGIKYTWTSDTNGSQWIELGPTNISGTGGGGGGTVTSVSVVTANGISGSVATSTTTPAITLTLGDITPTSVAASGTVTGSNLSGTNTGDQDLSGLVVKANNLSDLTNVATARTNLGLGSLATLSTVNNANWSGTALSIANGGTAAITAVGACANLGAARLTASNVFTNQQSVTPYRADISGAVSIDLANTAKSNSLHLTITGNVTSFALTNPVDGAVYNFRFIQNETGGWTMPSMTGGVFKWSGGTGPTWTTTAGAWDFVSMQYGATEGNYACSQLPNMS